MNQNLLNPEEVVQKKIKEVRYILAIAAGKGGVGKSATATNLALTLQKAGYQVGVLDADLYGPSLGKMMPLEKGVYLEEESICPGEFHGVRVFSLSHVKPDAMIVRAPVVNGLILQCMSQVLWGELDYLIVDFPPGTGDIQLTLMQTLPFSGAVLVTTPQEVSLLDVEKAAEMFHKMEVPIIGVIENMSYFTDPVTKEHHHLFGEGGGKSLAEQYGIPFLGQIPIDREVSRCCDLGKALPFDLPENAVTRVFEEIGGSTRKYLFAFEQASSAQIKQFEYYWKELD